MSLITAVPPTFTRRHRPVLVDMGLLDDFSPLRLADGRVLRIEWGEPDAEGHFEPVFTSTDDGHVVISRAVLAELERRAGGYE